jgi:type I restriction enzyme M protein
VNLDIFWLRDESQDDGAGPDDPDVIALEMVEDLRAVLEELEAIAADLAPDEQLAPV